MSDLTYVEHIHEFETVVITGDSCKDYEFDFCTICNEQAIVQHPKNCKCYWCSKKEAQCSIE